MNRISRREAIIQAVAVIGLWLTIVALAARQDEIDITQALAWSLTLKHGYYFAWVFALCLIVLYNFVVSVGLIIRSRIKGESNKIATKTTVQVVLLVSLLSGTIMALQFTSKRRAETTFTQAVANTNDYRILYPEDMAAFESGDDFRISSNEVDHLLITSRDGTKLMVVFNHERKLIVVQKLSP